MPDPIVGAIVAKAANTISDETGPVASSLLQRVLGPPAEEFGEALRRSVAYRTRNFGRIIRVADKKLASTKTQGVVNPRVAYVLLEEGSLCDEELMAEYLGGVLASSRSIDGRDDRAVTWARLVVSLSSFQVRAHYLLYREWAARLRGAPGLQLKYRYEMEDIELEIDLDEFTERLTHGHGQSYEGIVSHSIRGLIAAELLQSWAHGTAEELSRPYRRYPYGIGQDPDDDTADNRFGIAERTAPPSFANTLRVAPSGRGFELYGWAQGLPGLLPEEVTSKAEVIELDDQQIPRLSGVVFTGI